MISASICSSIESSKESLLVLEEGQEDGLLRKGRRGGAAKPKCVATIYN
jgi:hypothetical protein